MSLERSELAPARAREALRELLGGDPVGAAQLTTVVLLVSEVVANAVVHPDVGADSEIELSVVAGQALTRVVVSDGGTGFVAPAGSHESAGGGGYGLMLLQQVSSRWGTSNCDGRFSVWFEVDHPLT